MSAEASALPCQPRVHTRSECIYNIPPLCIYIVCMYVDNIFKPHREICQCVSPTCPGRPPGTLLSQIWYTFRFGRGQNRTVQDRHSLLLCGKENSKGTKMGRVHTEFRIAEFEDWGSAIGGVQTELQTKGEPLKRRLGMRSQ